MPDRRFTPRAHRQLSIATLGNAAAPASKRLGNAVV